VQIGHRHILAVYPFVFLLGGLALQKLGRRFEGFAPIAVGLMCLEGFFLAPNFLPYFNVAAGGPGQGHRYLTDSNNDWGQGLKQLAAALTPLRKQLKKFRERRVRVVRPVLAVNVPRIAYKAQSLGCAAVGLGVTPVGWAPDSSVGYARETHFVLEAGQIVENLSFRNEEKVRRVLVGMRSNFVPTLANFAERLGKHAAHGSSVSRRARLVEVNVTPRRNIELGPEALRIQRIENLIEIAEPLFGFGARRLPLTPIVPAKGAVIKRK
jgi:hypothetical protein